jgi:hypothetical protein
MVGRASPYRCSEDDDWMPVVRGLCALDAIRAALHEGMYWVIDADVTAYFDTIPHRRDAGRRGRDARVGEALIGSRHHG